jgi:hypothetical protein
MRHLALLKLRNLQTSFLSLRNNQYLVDEDSRQHHTAPYEFANQYP